MAARQVTPKHVELSWYTNVSTRFHEVTIELPREAFITCVGLWRYDEQPHIFVKSSWLEELYGRAYSVFGWIDAIGVKQALRARAISSTTLVRLRTEIDVLAARYPTASFISFADNLLLPTGLIQDGGVARVGCSRTGPKRFRICKTASG